MLEKRITMLWRSSSVTLSPSWLQLSVPLTQLTSYGSHLDTEQLMRVLKLEHPRAPSGIVQFVLSREEPEAVWRVLRPAIEYTELDLVDLYTDVELADDRVPFFLYIRVKVRSLGESCLQGTARLVSGHTKANLLPKYLHVVLAVLVGECRKFSGDLCVMQGQRPGAVVRVCNALIQLDFAIPMWTATDDW